MSPVGSHTIREDRIARPDISLLDQDEQSLDSATKPRLLRLGACQFVLAALPLIIGELQHFGQQFPKTLTIEQPPLKQIEYHVVELLAPHAGAHAAAAAVHSGIAAVIGIAPALASSDSHTAAASGHAAGCDPGEERGAGRDMRSGLARIARGTERGNAFELLLVDDDRAGDRNGILDLRDVAVVIRGTVVIGAGVDGSRKNARDVAVREFGASQPIAARVQGATTPAKEKWQSAGLLGDHIKALSAREITMIDDYVWELAIQ